MKALPFLKKAGCLITALLTLCIALPLSACGRAVREGAPPAEERPAESRSGYFVQFTPLPESMALSTDQCANEEVIFVCGLDLQNRPLLSRYSHGEYTPVALPEDVSYVHACCLKEDGVAVLAGDCPQFWLAADGTPRQSEASVFSSCLLLFDAEGNLTERLPLSPEISSGAKYDSLLWDGTSFYLMSPADFLQLSAEGALVNRLHLEGGCFISQTLTNGGLAISLFDSSTDGGDDTVRVKLLSNPERFTFTPVYSDEQLVLVGMGRNREGNLLINLGDRIVSLNAQYAEADELFRFDSAGLLNASFPRLYPSPDGLLLAAPNTERLTQLVCGELPEKEELVLWLPWSDAALTEWIEGFNLTNTEYSVVVERVDLSDAQREDALRAKVIAGNGPDLYFTGGSGGFGGLRAGAVFEDLSPYLDGSGQLSREDLLPAALDAATEDGGLYAMPVDFTLFTMSEQRGLLPQEDMSLSELFSLPAVQDGSLTVFPSDMSQDSLWYWLSTLYLFANLDEETGTCPFDTPEYKELLSCCRSGRAFNSPDPVPSIFSFQQLPGIRRLIYLQTQYGDDIALFAGLGTVFSMEHSFAISNASAQKDGAWQFIEYVLTADLSKQEFSWPVAAAGMERLIEKACTIGLWLDEEKGCQTLSASNAALLRDFFSQSSGAGTVGQHPALIRIMQEEAAKYFAGDKSVDETAAMTQSRARLYLAEQYG